MISSLTSVGAEEIQAQLRYLGKRLTQQAIAATVDDMEAFVSTEAGKHTKPGGTGALFRSVYSRPIDGEGEAWEIGHDLQAAPHALYVHWGTRPHIIRPKNKKVLRWAGPAGFVFSGEVHHPGYRGDPWLVRAADEAPRVFRAHVSALLKQKMGY